MRIELPTRFVNPIMVHVGGNACRCVEPTLQVALAGHTLSVVRLKLSSLGLERPSLRSDSPVTGMASSYLATVPAPVFSDTFSCKSGVVVTINLLAIAGNQRP
jgi:hypothetical protein